MIIDIIKSVFKNFQTFLVVWVVVLITNQLLIFGGCMESYCILAAIPHTVIISMLIVYFMINEKKDKVKSSIKKTKIIEVRKSEYELLLEKKKNGKLTTFEKSKLGEVTKIQTLFC